MDPGLATMIATGLVSLAYLALGLVELRRGRHGYAAARLFAALLFFGVTYYLAVYQVLLF
jgi:hypothetical protein